ncbi:PilZ domain-containing protein [Pseudorhodoferax sp.]|uniref:PilZ domain-containing protein n=1 Tax=Pseudorhodoferax sp. TaxID=1993553 RepID=UPI002DD6A473|nr:PilZ domain-containing protein [Pseudorhodoferax sp.]
MSLFASNDATLPIIEPIGSSLDQMALQIDDPRRVLAIVRDLAMQAEPATLYPVDGQPHLSGRLVQVTEPGRRIVVHLEGPALPAAGPALLVAAPGNLRLQFTTVFDWQQRAGGRVEGTAELPASLVQLQRRRFARQETPLGPTLRAVFQAKGKRRVLSVDDLSLGGVGLRGPLRDHRDLVAGLRLERVRLELGTVLLMDLRLDICSRRPYKSFLAGEQLHFGCEFVDLGDSAQATLQKILERLGSGGGAFQDTAL